jgi:hypothetical protein
LKKLFLFQAIFLHELLNAAFSIDKLLLASEERVTARTDFHVNFFFRGTSMNDIAAGAANHSIGIFRMDPSFHNVCFLAFSKTRQRQEFAGVSDKNRAQLKRFPSSLRMGLIPNQRGASYKNSIRLITTAILYPLPSTKSIEFYFKAHNAFYRLDHARNITTAHRP